MVGINATRRGAELAPDIRHADCRVLVTDADHLGLLVDLDPMEDLGLTSNAILDVADSRYLALLRAHDGSACRYQNDYRTRLPFGR